MTTPANGLPPVATASPALPPLPPQLPDHRTAERLLNLLDQLANTLRQRPAALPTGPTGPARAALDALQRENAQLRQQHAAARARLATLLATLQAAAQAPAAQTQLAEPSPTTAAHAA